MTLLAIGVLVALALAAAWWLGFLTPEPEEVSLEETVAAVQAQAEDEDGAEAASTRQAEEPTPAPTEQEVAPSPESTERPLTTAIDVPTGSTALAGEWRVEPGDSTFVGYRADSPTGEAVGRTRGIEGALIASDDQVLVVDISADMSSLASDSRVRDDHLGTEGLETRRFPTSRFVLTEPIPIDIVAADGVSGEFEAVGELTVKEITQPVVIVLEGTVVGDKLVIVGSTALDLNAYGATISGIEKATMEFSLVFAQKT